MMATCTATQSQPSGSGIHIELEHFPHVHLSPETQARDGKNVSFDSTNGISVPEDIRDDFATPPDTAVEALPKWNYPRENLYRVLCCFWSFFTFGMNDGSLGVNILPSI